MGLVYAHTGHGDKRVTGNDNTNEGTPINGGGGGRQNERKRMWFAGYRRKEGSSFWPPETTSRLPHQSITLMIRNCIWKNRLLLEYFGAKITNLHVCRLGK